MFGVRLEGLQHSYLPVSKSFGDSEIFQLWRQLPTFGFGKHHTFNKHPDKKTIMHLDSEGIMNEGVVMNRGIGGVPIDNEPEKLNDELVELFFPLEDGAVVRAAVGLKDRLDEEVNDIARERS